MLLAFDIGNSNTVLGVFRGDELLTNWRIETDPHKSADEYGMLVSQLFAYDKLNMDEVDDIIISTVVPSVLFTLEHMSMKYFGCKPIVVESGVKTGLVIKYDNPKQVGADRIVNAVAAVNKFGGPLIIIDFGTATYLGGTIAPGLKISSEALFEKTAKLPKVELDEPGHTICKNTVESMQSGLIYGHMGLVEFMVREMKKELAEICGKDKPIKVVATGGLASMIAGGVDCIDEVDKMLTLEGLKVIYEKNKKPCRHDQKDYEWNNEELG